MGELVYLAQEFQGFSPGFGIDQRAKVFSGDLLDIVAVLGRCQVYDRAAEIRQRLDEAVRHRRPTAEIHHDTGQSALRPVQGACGVHQVVGSFGQVQPGFGEQVGPAEQ